MDELREVVRSLDVAMELMRADVNPDELAATGVRLRCQHGASSGEIRDRQGGLDGDPAAAGCRSDQGRSARDRSATGGLYQLASSGKESAAADSSAGT